MILPDILTDEVIRTVNCFDVDGTVSAVEQIKKGYINRTYCVTVTSSRGTAKYTLQRINTDVFPDVDMLMSNFYKATEHLKGTFSLPGSESGQSVQSLIPTKDGKSFLDTGAECWRLMQYFDGVYSMDIPDSPEAFRGAGSAFGLFVSKMSDFEPSEFGEVIKNFHNTYSRYCDLEKAISADPVGRVKDVADEIAFVRARKNRFDIISSALDCGRIPFRICHNDCNLNNILFSEKTHLPAALIDLDTVMPGSPLYDYGDSMRIGTNTAKDDEKDLSKVRCDLNLYEAYARGYLESAGAMLTAEELALLPYAALIITSEDSIRFLADYINGDIYYTTSYSEQNLDRARTQLTLLADMERKLGEIKKILSDVYKDYGLCGDPYKYDFETEAILI